MKKLELTDPLHHLSQIGLGPEYGGNGGHTVFAPVKSV
jgi:hypothetical protein